MKDDFKPIPRKDFQGGNFNRRVYSAGNSSKPYTKIVRHEDNTENWGQSIGNSGVQNPQNLHQAPSAPTMGQSSQKLIPASPTTEEQDEKVVVSLNLGKFNPISWLKFNLQKLRRINYEKPKLYARRSLLLLIAIAFAGTIFDWRFLDRKTEAQYLGDATSGKGTICYSDGTTTPKTRSWSPGATNFGTTETSTAASENSFQTVIKQNPIKLDEWLCAVQDNAGNIDILRSTDGGSTWSLNSDDIAATGGTATTRRFDLAFQQLSGKAVLAYSKNATTNEIAQKVWDGSSWSSEVAEDLPGTSNIVTWVELTEKKYSDEIAMGYLTNGSTNNIGAGVLGTDAIENDWTVSNDTAATQISSMVIDTTNSVLYAGTASGGIIYRCAISTSCDAAGDWTTSNDTVETAIYSMVFDSVNGVIYAGSFSGAIVLRCAVSTACDAAGDWTTSYDMPETSVDSLTIDTTNAVLYAGTGGNGIIYRCALSTSCDAAGDWTTSNDTSEANIYALTFDSSNGVIYAGTGGNGIIYRCAISTACDAAGDWTTSYDTTEQFIRSFTIDTTNSVLYATTNGSGAWILRCALSTSCDASSDWTITYDSNKTEIRTLAFDSTNGVLYSGTSTNSTILRCAVSSSCDADGDWSTVFNESSETRVDSIVIDSINGVIYAGTSATAGIIYRCATSTGCNSPGGLYTTTSFGTCDQTAVTPDGVDKCFDINYGSADGYPIMSWGTTSAGNAADTLRASRWDGSSWTTAVISTGAAGEDGTHLDCESDPDPTSTMIGCGSVGNGSDDVQGWVIRYVGGAAGTGCGAGSGANNYTCSVLPSLDTAVHTDSAGRMFVAAGWMVNGVAKKLAIAFADGAADTDLDHFTYDAQANNWSGTLTTVSEPYTTQEENIQAVQNPYNPSELIFIILDAAATTPDLFAMRFTMDSAGAITTAGASNGAALEASGTSTQGTPVGFAFEPNRSRATLDQKGYIWENDDEDFASGDANDENSQLAAADTAITVPKGSKANLRIQAKNTGGAMQNQNLGLFYDRNDGIWSKIGNNIPADTTNGTGCTDNKFTCVAVDSSNDTGGATRLSVDSSGTPWISYYDFTATDLRVARYVGSGGTGCASTAWVCQTIDSTNAVGGFSSIAFSNSGAAWIAYRDATSLDLKVAQFVGSGGTGCAVTSWTCTAVDSTNDVGWYVSIAFDSLSNPWVSYYDNTNSGLRVAKYVSSGGTGCAVTSWTCTAVDTTNTVGQFTSIAFNYLGIPWISYRDATGNDLRIAQYVGSGGTGCAVTSWSCTTVYATNDSGSDTSLAIDKSGQPWVSFRDNTNSDLIVAQYVGSGGTGCAVTSWTCTAVHTSISINYETSIAFNPNGGATVTYYDDNNADLYIAQYVGSGGTGCAVSSWTCTSLDTSVAGQWSSLAYDNSANLWVAYRDGGNSDLKVANLADRAGELLVSPSAGAQNGNSTSESHADMSSVSDSSNRDDADCISGGTWQNGAANSAEEHQANFNGGNSTGHCTEYSFTIDTSQAVAGRTYRIILSSKDNWTPDKNAWRGASAYTQYATITVTDSVFRAGKDYSPKFADCSNTSWGCEAIDTTNSVGESSSTAFDSSGNPWVSYRDFTNTDLRVAQYVGSGGSGCASSAWTCTTIDTDNAGAYTSIYIGTSGAPIIAYQGNNISNLKVAQYVGSGGSGCASSAWTCTTVNLGNGDGHMALAIDNSGKPWISFKAPTVNDLKVAQYVGSGGSGCASSAWTCTTVDSANDYGNSSSIAFDNSGTPWVSYGDNTNFDLRVAQYVGSGGSGCASSAWTCTTVDSTGNTGLYPKIAIGNSGNPWVSYFDSTNGDLRVAQYVGSGGSGCASSAWTCTTVDTTTTVGENPSIAVDSASNPWVSYFNNGNDDLMVARYVGSGGSGCASAAWTCVAVDNNTGFPVSSLAFDNSGTPWISYNDFANNDLRIAKLHRSEMPFYFNNLHKNKLKNAGQNFARYKLSPGASPNTTNGACGSAVADYTGLCAMFQNNGNYDTIVAQANQSPYLTLAMRYDNTNELPTAQWFGRTNYAPNTAGTAGDIVLQVYRYGSTNAWETVASDTASSDCNTPGAGNCSLSGMPSGTPSQYFSSLTDGGYWIYFRLYQEPNTGGTITFKTDQFKAAKNAQRMRHGQFFQDETKRALNFR